MSNFVKLCEKFDYGAAALAAMLGKFLAVSPNVAEAMVYVFVVGAYVAYRIAKIGYAIDPPPPEIVEVKTKASSKLSKDVDELNAKMSAVMLRLGFDYKQ